MGIEAFAAVPFVLGFLAALGATYAWGYRYKRRSKAFRAILWGIWSTFVLLLVFTTFFYVFGLVANLTATFEPASDRLVAVRVDLVLGAVLALAWWGITRLLRGLDAASD